MYPRMVEGSVMKACTVLISKVWAGWYVHLALLSIKWLLILGFILAAFGIMLSYTQNLAELGS